MIVIDGNNWCWRAGWIGRDLSYKGKGTGVLHVGLSMLATLSELFPPQRLMFLWDSKDSWRKKLYPEYKANRQADPERVKARSEVYRQIDVFRLVLTALGVTQVCEEGLEADDLAGIISTGCNQSGRPLIMISTDNDWFQLLTKNNYIVRGWNNKKRLEIVRDSDVLNKFGVPATDFPKYQALIGESGDNIPKVRRGIGPVTAVKILQGLAGLSVEEQVQYDLNLRLTTLRREGKVSHKWPAQTKQGWQTMESLLHKHGLNDVWLRRGKLWLVGKWGR